MKIISASERSEKTQTRDHQLAVKDKPITNALRTLTTTLHPDQERYLGLTYADVLARKLWEMAIGGDLRAVQEIVGRVGGRTVQVTELQGPQDSDIELDGAEDVKAALLARLGLGTAA